MTARRGGTAIALLFCAGAVVSAQEVPPGFLATLDVSQRLEYSDNPDLRDDGTSDLFGRTQLDFGLNSVTKVQSFVLNLGAEIEEFRDDRADGKDGVEMTTSYVNLGYDRNTGNALIGVNLGYREADNFSDFTDEEFDADGNVIRQDSGTRETYTFGLNGEVGREAPFGALYSYSYTEINYAGTSDPDLRDQRRDIIEGRLRFDLTPRVSGFLGAKYNDLDTQGDGVDREETEVSVGADLIVNSVLTADVSMGYSEIERSGAETGTDKGFTGGFGLTWARPDGSWGLDFSTAPETNDNGRRSFLSARRAKELPRGNLNYSLGFTGAGSAIGNNPLFSVDYTEAFSGGQITVGLSQNVTTDDENDESINTSLRANYDHRINSISSFGVGLSLFNNNRLDDDGNDAQRVNLDLTYRYDLTRDWGLVSGYSYTLSKEDDRDDRTRNTIFVGLQRSFNWVP